MPLHPSPLTIGGERRAAGCRPQATEGEAYGDGQRETRDDSGPGRDRATTSTTTHSRIGFRGGRQGALESAVRRPTIDHVTLRAGDLAASRRFYEAVLAPLGAVLAPLGIGLEFERAGLLAFGSGEGGRLIVQAGERHLGDIHVAFSARRREAVDALHAAALQAGGRDNGAPGPRPEYHWGYYGAYALDPDGNNVEAVHHTIPSGEARGESQPQEFVIPTEERSQPRWQKA
jgi:catechol 2,3-dioxygenase-like lactoylglutathione lyase family enzyme